MIKKVAILFCIIIQSTHLYGQSIELQKLEKIADSLYYKHSIYTSENEFKKEIAIRQDVLNEYLDTTSTPYKISLTKKYASEAALLNSKMEYELAIVKSKKALEIYKEIDNKNQYFLGHIYKNLYDQYSAIEAWDTVLELTKKTLNIFKDTLVDNHKLIAEVEFDIGSVLNHFGDYTNVIAQYKKAVDKSVAYDGENNADAAYYEHHLALIYGFIGYYKKELESYKNVIRRWESIDYSDMSYLAVAYGSLSTWYLQHGDSKIAEQYLIKKENLIKSNKKDIKNWFNETFSGRTQLDTWHNYADLYLYKKDTVKALAYNNKVLDYLAGFDVNDKRNNPHNLPYSKNFVYLSINYALKFEANLLKNKHPEKAKKLYEEALSTINKASVVVSALTSRLNLVECNINMKDYDAANKIIDEEIKEAQNNKRYFDLIQLYAMQADIAVELDDIGTMDEKYKLLFNKFQRDTLRTITIQNLKQDECKPYGNNEIINLLLKGGKNYKKAFVKTSIDDYLKKAYNLNVLTSTIFSENFSFLIYNDQTHNTVSKINEQLLNTALLLIDKDAYENVIQNIEDSNSRLSWKKFLSSRQKKHLDIPDSILEKENDLKSALHFYKKTLFTGNESNEDKLKQYNQKLYEIETEIEQLEKWYQYNYPSYFNQTQKPFKIADLKRNLRKNQQIIKYVVTEEQVYGFAITKEAIELVKLGDKEVLYKKLNAFITNLNEGSLKNYKTLAQELYQILLPEILLGDSKKQHFIFIQDDLLNLLPMETLMDVKEKYFIQSHSISYAPSLLLWNEQLKVKKSRRNKLGIFVPTYKDYYKENPKRNDSTALFGAFSEAMQIANIFKSDMYSGKEASKQEFIDKAANYNMLHLAMHSTIINTDADFSSLSFSPDKSDNRLFISELYNIKLNADLAVLSACNTGAGPLRKGEGLLNVSRAFTYAGVPSIVTSLWSVPDKETSKIMISFYEYLKSGKSKDKALQLAKLDYLNNTDDVLLKHPYYWAGFVVSGDISPIESSTNWWWMYLIFGILFIGLIFSKRLFKLF